MNQKSGVPHRQSFTEKQGEYLAFIYAYSRMFRRPPPKPTCSATSASAHLPSTRWCSPSNAPASSGASPGSPEASKSSFHQKNCPSSNGSISTSQILCDEVLARADIYSRRGRTTREAL